MREMKDSGLQWMGKIPTSWNVVPIGTITDEVTAKNYDGSEKNALKFTYGSIISKNNFDADKENYVAKTIRTYTKVKPGNIILNGLNLNYDFVSQRIGLVKDTGVITSAYLSMSVNPAQCVSTYLAYLFKGLDAYHVFHHWGKGLRQTLSYEILKKYKIAIPELSVQQAIADFLDTKCADIDSLTEDIQKQIETLKEYKKSVITQAVTKGLDPNVEMKNSGIEWLGRIPKTWKMSKIKFVSITRNSKEKYDNSYDVYIGLENVIGFTDNIIKTDTVYPNNIYDTCKKGDVLFSKLRPYLGKVIISPRNCFCTGEFMCFYNFYGDARYLKYWMRNQQFIKEVDMSTYGTKMPRANPNFILNMPIAIPERAEQKVIADFLDTKCADIDAAIEEKQKQLDVLKEYKKSLIYEYVTGKKEVPRHE